MLSPVPGREEPFGEIEAETDGMGSALQKGSWAVSWTWDSRAPWPQRRPSAFRSIPSRSREEVIPLYSALVTLLLKRWIQSWNPRSKRDTNKWEQVQGRAAGWLRAGALTLWGDTNGLGLVQPGVEKTWVWGPHSNLPLPIGMLVSRHSQALCSSAWWENEKQQT